MDEFKVYRRKGAGAAERSAQRHQEEMDEECIRIVNERSSSACPSAVMTFKPEVPEIKVQAYKKRNYLKPLFAGIYIASIVGGFAFVLNDCLPAGAACIIAAVGAIIALFG